MTILHINKQIIELQEKLNKLISLNDNISGNMELLKLSQELDKLISEYYRDNSDAINDLNIEKLA